MECLVNKVNGVAKGVQQQAAGTPSTESLVLVGVGTVNSSGMVVTTHHVQGGPLSVEQAAEAAAAAFGHND